MKPATLLAIALAALFIGSLIALHAILDEGWFYIAFVPHVMIVGAACERIHSRFT